MAQDFAKMCRTCLDKALAATSLFSLQYINQKELSLAQMLRACTSIVILEDDSLPKQVCSQCEVNIFNTYNFLQQCKQSNSLLQTIITEGNRKLELKHPDINIVSGNSTLESPMHISNIFNSSNSGQENDQNDTDSFGNEVNALSEVVEQPMKENVMHMDQDESYNNISGNFEGVYITPYTFNENQMNFSNYNHNRGFKELNIQKSNIPLEDETMQPLFACEAKGCSSCFTSAADLKLHNRTHISKQNICKICNKLFSSASTLSRHMSSKHQPEKKTRVCRDCGKSFSRQVSIIKKTELHLVRYIGVGYNKEKCNLRSDDLRRHIRVHTGDRPFSCEKCGKAFSQSFRLLEHIRSHSNVKNFICAVCGKGFARYTSLLVHNKTHNQVKSHECAECGKRLCGASSLAAHMKMHSGQKNFACGFCKKRFASASNLVVHKRTHTGERPYPCLTCGKSFPDNSRLNVHSRIHSGEKPYICTSCGRGCISSTQLKRHMRIHTGEKPFCCYICSKCFMRSEELKNHIKMHKGERNHVCAICSKGFFQKNTLKVHMRIHTGEKPFSCNVCHKSFLQSGPCCVHLKTHCTEETYTTQQTECKSGDADYL